MRAVPRYGEANQRTEDKGQKCCRGCAALLVNVPRNCAKNLTSDFNLIAGFCPLLD